TTHFDFDQQLGRVRNPGAVRVWVDRRRFHYETSLDVVRRELLEDKIASLVVDVSKARKIAALIDDDPLLEMAATITAEQRCSMNSPLRHFVEHKRAQGYTIEVIDYADESGAGRELLRQGSNLGDAEYAEKMCAAPPLHYREYAYLQNELDRGRPISAEQWCSLQRTRMELFYRQPITIQLVALDNRGRYRAAVATFEAIERQLATENEGSARKPLDRALRFLRSRDDQAASLARLLGHTPLIRGASWDCDVVFGGD